MKLERRVVMIFSLASMFLGGCVSSRSESHRTQPSTQGAPAKLHMYVCCCMWKEPNGDVRALSYYGEAENKAEANARIMALFLKEHAGRVPVFFEITEVDDGLIRRISASQQPARLAF